MVQQNVKGIPSYFFQHFFEIAKRTFSVKTVLHSTNPTKRLSFTLKGKSCRMPFY